MVARSVVVNVIGNADSAKKAFDDTGSKAEQSAAKIGSLFKGVFGNMRTMAGDALGPVVEGVDKLGEAFDRAKEHGGKVSAAMAGIGTAAVGVGASLAGLGSKEQAASQQLKQAIDNAGQSYEDYAKQIERSIKTNERFGHSSVDTQEAVRILTQATGDTGKALKDMSVVSDLAAAKHESLATAATSLARVHGGATKVLKEFGITAEKAADNSKQLAVAQKAAEVADLADSKAKENLVMLHERLAGKTKLTVAEHQSLVKAEEAVVAADAKASDAHKKLADMHVEVTTKVKAADDNITALGDKLKGQASAASDTFMGHLKAVGVQFEDQAAKIGQKYGPAIMGAGAAVDALAGVMHMFSGSAAAASVAGDVMAGSETAMGVAGDAAAPGVLATVGPVVLLVAGVALLAVGIYELVKHWKTVWSAIKTAVGDAVGFVKGLIGDVVHWIKGHWQEILAILTGPFGLAALFIKDHFHEILNFIEGIPGKISNIASGMWDGISNSFKGMINFIIGMWDHLSDLSAIHIPSIDVGPIHIGGQNLPPFIPHIPFLAEGGIVMSPTLAMIGEKGPEAVVPLGSGSGAGSLGVVVGGGDLVLQVDGQTLGRIAGPVLRTWFLRNTRRDAVNIGLT